MQDDKQWLLHPVLPRPPALPKLGPELWALIGLDAPDEPSASSPSVASCPATEARSHRDTESEALASASGVHACARVVRTGT
jgi:hypothetical protein